MEISNPNDACPVNENLQEISVLLLDSAENEGVDFLQAMNRKGMKFISERVGGKEELFRALETNVWDILLVNDLVSSLDQNETMAYVRHIKSDAGYVLLSHDVITIDFLADAYQQGISDVVSSHHLDYSVEVFSRAAQRSRRNYQLSLLNQEKFELATHRDQLMSGTEEALAYLQDGIHVFANDAYQKMLGYKKIDDLAYLPFIDIVTTELQDRVKQQLLDFGHTLRIKPDQNSMEMDELFLTGTGDKEGILEVQATLQTVVYDGEDCLQIVLRDKSAMAEREADNAVEGFGYPLFLSHLENYVSEAQVSGSQTGHVVHVHGEGFEHYIAGKGFGSLNGKLKALASGLKSGLETGDYFIRFTEKSFLFLIKGDNKQDAKIVQTGELLKKFEIALNREIGADEQFPKVVFKHEVIPVTNESESAEQLIKTFLLGPENRPEVKAEEVGSAPAKGTQATESVLERVEKRESAKTDHARSAADETENNVVPFAKKTGEEDSSKISAREDNEQVSDAAETNSDHSAAKQSQATQQSSADELASQSEETGRINNIEQKYDAETASADETELSVKEINDALTANKLELCYEPMISVADIETEYYDLGLYLKEGGGKLSREKLGNNILENPVANKLDMWALVNALEVVGGLYNQGQEHRVLLPMNAKSLSEKRLPEFIKKEMASFALPAGMVVLDFALADIITNAAENCHQLDKLKEAGALACVSGIKAASQLDEILQQCSISLARLDNALIAQASTDDKAFAVLQDLIQKLHDSKVKVAAGDINDSKLLSVCCKAKIDLVTGTYIQKDPLALTADSISEAIAI